MKISENDDIFFQWMCQLTLWSRGDICIDGLVQDCSNSIANALELQQTCIKPSACTFVLIQLHFRDVSDNQSYTFREWIGAE